MFDFISNFYEISFCQIFYTVYLLLQHFYFYLKQFVCAYIDMEKAHRNLNSSSKAF